MNSARCAKCSLLNFASSTVCKRCGEPLEQPAGDESYNQTGDPNGSHAAQDGYETTAEPHGYGAQYRPSLEAAHPQSRSGKGKGATLLAVLCLVALIGIPVYLKTKGTNDLSNLSWREFKPEDGSFSIQMPAQPKLSAASLPSPAGMMQMNMYYLETSGKTAFAVGTIEFPSAANIPVDQLFDKAIQSISQRSGAIILSRKNISLDDHQGVELEIKPPASANKDGDKGVARLYWAPPRIFMVMVGGPDSSEAVAARAKYLDSFKIRAWR